MAQIDEFYDHVGPGWFDILEGLHIRLRSLDPEYKVADVKEKFGGLRVYLYDETPPVWQAIADAEDKSLHTCDQCGGKGKAVLDHGWWLTRCATHDPHLKEVK